MCNNGSQGRYHAAVISWYNFHAMKNPFELKRILIFLGFAFGIAWLAALIIHLTGGLVNNPLALPLETIAVMGAPAAANLLTRLLTREGWKDLYLRPRLRQAWRYWALLWIAPALLTIAGAAIYFLVFPEHFDPSLQRMRQLTAASLHAAGNISPWLLLGAGTLQAIVLSPLLNGLFTLGEEFGWRAYLQPRLMPLGGRVTMVIMGITWGVWHWPLIAMGHNYGLNYTGAPWLGMLVMLWFTLAAGTLLGWATLRSGSVWPAVVGHAAVNGIAGLSALATAGQPSPLVGPLPVGLIGSVGFAVVALLIFLYPDALRSPKSPQDKGAS